MECNPETLTIQDFKILRTIGCGTFGRVKLAQLRGNDKMPPFALKILRKNLIIKYKQVDHVKSEKIILTLAKHPFIVNFFMSFQDESFVYFLFEYICGGELFSLIRTVVSLEPEVIKFYSSQIVLALEYLHSIGAVYRDIKPENILIDKKGYLKLTDFGFAKIISGKTYTMCGTPEYMAPEVIMKGEGYDFHADWWSFGVLLFEMVEGLPPFVDDNPIVVYQKILAGKYKFLKKPDRKLKNLIKKLLKESSKRIGRKNGAAEIFSHDFYKKLNWTDVYNKKITAPWVPQVESKEDTQYFGEYLDTEEQSASNYGSVDVNFIFNEF